MQNRSLILKVAAIANAVILVVLFSGCPSRREFVPHIAAFTSISCGPIFRNGSDVVPSISPVPPRTLETPLPEIPSSGQKQ